MAEPQPYRHLAGSHQGIDVAAASGGTIIDTSGRRYIDFTMGWGVGNLGWGREDIRAALRDFDGPDYVSPSFRYAPWEELAGLLVSIAPGKLTRCYRATGGTEAVDIALQLATAATGRKKLVSLEHAYHGNSIATLSVGESSNRELYPALLAGCKKLAPPLDERAAGKLETLLRGGDVAALVMEPIPLALGVHVPDPVFMTRAARLCRRHGTLLVADEVACGFGRTGALFACEHYGWEPDILCLGKAITAGYAGMGATLVSDRVARQLGDRVDPWSTYGWHPRSVAAALATVRHFMANRERILANVAAMSALIREGLLAMGLPSPCLCIQGLAIAVHLGDEERAEKIGERAREQGLLLIAESGVVGMSPPLDVDAETATRAVEILAGCL